MGHPCHVGQLNEAKHYFAFLSVSISAKAGPISIVGAMRESATLFLKLFR